MHQKKVVLARSAAACGRAAGAALGGATERLAQRWDASGRTAGSKNWIVVLKAVQCYTPESLDSGAALQQCASKPGLSASLMRCISAMHFSAAL